MSYLDKTSFGVAKYVASGAPAGNIIGAQVNDLYVDDLTGIHFHCTDATFGSQQWLGTDGITYPAAIAAFDHPDLYLAYTMDNISGSTLVDEAVGRNGNLIAGASSITGLVGNGILCNGTTQGIEMDHDIPNDFSVSIWVKTTTTATSAFFGQAPNTGGSRTGFIAASTGLAGFNSRTSGGTYQQVLGTTNVADGLWHHLVASQVGTTIYLYVDSVLEDSLDMGTTQTNWAAASWLGFEYKDNSVTLPLAGTLDQCRIFTRQLTQEEITALYNAGVGV